MDLRERGRGPAARHPWELARVRALRGILAAAGAPARRARVLDIGCGDAFTVEALFAGRADWRIDAVDPQLSAEDVARIGAEHPAVQLHTTLEGLSPAAYDVVLLLDTLEHVEDDRGLLAQAAAFAAPGGLVLITVPAYPALFSAHDRFLGHLRRYRRAQLDRVVRDASLATVSRGSLFPELLALRLLARAAEALFGPPRAPAGVGRWRGGPALTTALTVGLDLGNSVALTLAARGLAPPGLTLWTLCRRPRS